MGLDMNLYKRTYVKNWDHMEEKEKTQVSVIREGQVLVKPDRIAYVTEEVGYWCKANAIHQWFVNECQDGRDECQDAFVSHEQLEELLALVTKVLDDHSLAEELLCPQGGFFFGSTDIDEGYFQDLEDTKKILEEALAEDVVPGDGEFYYNSSW